MFYVIVISIILFVGIGYAVAAVMSKAEEDAIIDTPKAYKVEPKLKEATRVCNACEEEKPMSHFAPIKVAGKMRTRRTCRACLEVPSNG